MRGFCVIFMEKTGIYLRVCLRVNIVYIYSNIPGACSRLYPSLGRQYISAGTIDFVVSDNERKVDLWNFKLTVLIV